MPNEKKFVIGCDFGTLSVRSVLFDIKNGEEIASSVYDYENGIIDQFLPGTNIEVPIDGALQDPRDYERGLVKTVKDIIKKSKANPANIGAIGTDFTGCTILPVKEDSTPLCFINKFKDNVHSWVKLWKDHSANKYVYKIIELAEKRKEKFLSISGGKISSEFFLPKTMMIVDQAEEIYSNADYIMEAGDWIVWRLTGNLSRNMAALTTRANYCDGFAPADFYKELDARLKDLYSKLGGTVLQLDQKAGYLTEKYQQELSLPEIPVAAGNIDSCVTVPACGVCDESGLVMIMGTSTCFMTVLKEYKESFGIEKIKNGILPGFWGYITGQSSVGDMFEWFIKNCIPVHYYEEAKSRSLGIHTYLRSLVEGEKPGAAGLLALDWFNGNRREILDANLSGLVMGMNIKTRPEEIYRALIESTGFGAKLIINAFEENDILIKELFATGGIPNKDSMTMQIYADITGKTIKIPQTSQPGALGSAIFASVAAGLHPDIKTAARHMTHIKKEQYTPNMQNNKIYSKLFNEYMKIYNYFTNPCRSVMKNLKDIKIAQSKKYPGTS